VGYPLLTSAFTGDTTVTRGSIVGSNPILRAIATAGLNPPPNPAATPAAAAAAVADFDATAATASKSVPAPSSVRGHSSATISASGARGDPVVSASKPDAASIATRDVTADLSHIPPYPPDSEAVGKLIVHYNTRVTTLEQSFTELKELLEHRSELSPEIKSLIINLEEAIRVAKSSISNLVKDKDRAADTKKLLAATLIAQTKANQAYANGRKEKMVAFLLNRVLQLQRLATAEHLKAEAEYSKAYDTYNSAFAAAKKAFDDLNFKLTHFVSYVTDKGFLHTKD
jgi:hypothetical protein